VSPGGGGSRSSGGGAHRIPGSGGGAPHRPTGDGRHGHDGGHHHGHGHSYYYYGYPYYYPYYGFSFGFGYPYYYPYYYGYGYGYYPYYGYRPYGYYAPYYGYPNAAYDGEGAYYPPPYADRSSLGAVAVKVRPKTAEVYVDGRFVGSADNFDGFPGYLWMAPGQHRVEVVQDGFANLTQDLDIAVGQVIELEQKLVVGDASRPVPPADRGYSRGAERAPYPEGGGYRPPDRYTEPRDSQAGDREPSPDLAELMLDVRPDDASVYLDGRFVGTGRQVSTATQPLMLMPGEHRLQVVHPEYAADERTVTMGAGEEKLVEVTLHRGEGV
jgi:hypothetical protein